MGTVIPSTPRRHEDRPPRWDRPRRAALCDPYRDRPARGLSLRQAAKARAVPRRTLQAWRASQDRLDDPPAVVAVFHSAPGLACLPRLGLGIPLVGTAGGAWGLRLGCLLVQRTGLERCVAAASGAQHQVNRQVAEAIGAYRREASARLAQARPATDLPGAQEATCTGGLCLVAMDPKSHAMLVAQAAPAGDHDTWQALMEQALSGLTGHRMHSTSAAAPARLA